MRYVDIAVIVVYLIGITWFGAQFKEKQTSLKNYFLGGRNTPWWAIGFSIVSAETSTLTVIGTPALAFYGNFGFLQVVFGYLLARIVITFLFLPHYFKGYCAHARPLQRYTARPAPLPYRAPHAIRRAIGEARNQCPFAKAHYGTRNQIFGPHRLPPSLLHRSAISHYSVRRAGRKRPDRFR